MSYVSIAVAVNNVMAELQETSDRQFQRYLQFGYRAFSDLNLFVLPILKATSIMMDDNLGIDLPKDFISYKTIGVCIGGEIITLTQDNEICLPRKVDECCKPIIEQITTPAPSEILSYYFLPFWRNGKYVSEQYGIMGGINGRGYFRVDTEKHRIQFASVVPKAEIILEYKSNNIEDCDGSLAVPEESIEAIIQYIHWKRLQNNPKIPVYEKNRAREDYFIQYKKMQIFNQQFTASEYRDNRYSSIKGIAHR